MLQPDKSEVIKDENMVEILEIDTKEEINNEETSKKDDEVNINAEEASVNFGVNDVVKKSPNLDQKQSTLPIDDPSLKDDHTEIMNKANTLRTLSKVINDGSLERTFGKVCCLNFQDDVTKGTLERSGSGEHHKQFCICCFTRNSIL